ncbi:MAG: diguanylate cyclase [Anaerolineales bacterium]
MHWNKFTLSLVAVGLFLLLFFALYLPLQPSGQVLEQGWTVEYQGVEKSNVRIPYIQRSSEAADVITFTITLNDIQGDSLIFRPGGYAFAVLLNGQQIAEVGELDEPTANVWNSVQLIPLTNLRPDTNTLQIKLSSANRAVGLGTSPYIDNLKTSINKITFINWMANDFLLINQGAGLIVGIILIAIAYSRLKAHNTELYMGIATILASIYVFDFDMRASTGSLAILLIVRKICLMSGYLGTLFFVFGLETYQQANVRISRFLAIPTVIASVILAIQPSQYSFSIVLIYLNIILFINLVTACVIIFRNRNIKDWLIIPAILLALSILESIVAMLFVRPWPFMTQYIVLFSSVFFGLNLILEFHQLYHENIALKVKANIDPLTGVFNRNILTDSLVQQYNTLALIDLDNFKYYNDRHGHSEGDKLLLLFVDVLHQNMRQDDLTVRIGGDEFLLLLHSNTLDQAQGLLERINKQFSKITPDQRVDLSYGIDLIKDSLEKSISFADKRMYEMKTTHKHNETGKVEL